MVIVVRPEPVAQKGSSHSDSQAGSTQSRVVVQAPVVADPSPLFISFPSHLQLLHLALS